MNPWPGAFTFHRGMDADSLLKVWRSEVTAGPSANPGEILQADAGGVVVACAGGNVRLLELQREGGRRLQVAEFLAGRPLPPGTFFRSKPAGVDLKL